MSTRMTAAGAAQMHNGTSIDPTKRPVPTVEEVRSWIDGLSEVAATGRIKDMLEHADEYDLPRSWHQGVEDGVVAVLVALEGCSDDAGGVGVAWIYEFCQELGVDAVRVVERVAAALTHLSHA